VKRIKATYLNVAKLAKVSPATVSRVARGNVTVAPALREKIFKAAQQVGVDLREKLNERSRTIAFLLANRDILNSFHARILVGAEAYCASHNWELLFLSFRYAAKTPVRDLHLPQILSRPSAVRALILGGTNSTNMLLALRERGIPFSVLGNNVIGDWDASAFDAVYSDDIQGARDLTNGLILEGHRDIWFFGDLQLPWYARCAEGYRTAMQAAGLTPRFSEIHSDDRQLGYLAMRSLLSRQEPVTAVFAGSDQIASGVYEALRQSCVAIPSDISVAGFNDTESQLLHPAVTTVREFPGELGKHLADFVLRRIETPGMPAQHLTMPTQLVVRESTGPLPESASSRMGRTVVERRAFNTKDAGT
jgi:DNA-binding LacI/PurR family transcriptional regulator